MINVFTLTNIDTKINWR